MCCPRKRKWCDNMTLSLLRRHAIRRPINCPCCSLRRAVQNPPKQQYVFSMVKWRICPFAELGQGAEAGQTFVLPFLAADAAKALQASCWTATATTYSWCPARCRRKRSGMTSCTRALTCLPPGGLRHASSCQCLVSAPPSAAGRRAAPAYIAQRRKQT